MEALDLQLARILAVVDELEGAALITADHGNADEMYEKAKKPEDAPKPKTAHTLNPVPFIVYDPEKKNIEVKEGTFGLANVAASVAHLLGLEKPEAWEESIIK